MHWKKMKYKKIAIMKKTLKRAMRSCFNALDFVDYTLEYI